ncbi:MAG TPA: hypothetical protein VGR51_02825, partial [Thermoplasmata archaeon]|nr:hypothetical protein [Thermoplasmata archaeon]
MKAFAAVLMLVLLVPLMPTSSASTETAPETADAEPTIVTDAHQDFTTDFTAVPMSPSEATAPFSIDSSDSEPIALSVETVAFSSRDTPSVLQGQSEDDHGGQLGNAPEALYKVLQKFLDRGVNPPAHFPVPYLVYTRSGATELYTDVLTKMPIMINVDESSSTGQGGKDIRVLTTIDVNPLVITSRVELLGDTHPADLRIIVAFPAFFYNGEAGAPDGETFWLFGYETLAGSQIPLEITMMFTVDVTLGTEHVFDFDWDAAAGIDPLGFTLETVQLQDLPPADLSNPFYPATTYFEVSSPDFASLTFTTFETPTSSTKCMVWSAASAFLLDYTFAEADDLGGTLVTYDLTATVDQVPTA